MKLALVALAASAAALNLTPLDMPSGADKKIQHLDASGEFTYLGDLNPTYESVGWGEYWVNRAWYDNGFTIGGVKYDNGIFAHAPSKVQYHLGKKFSWFAGCAGIDDFNGKQCLKTGTLTFKVYASLTAPANQASMKLIHTVKVSGNEACKPFRLGVKDVSVLQLEAEETDGSGACKDASWVDTKLYEDPVVSCERLSDMAPSHKSIGYDSYFVDPTWYQAGFIIDGVPYGHGVFAHANSKIIYPLHGKYHSFHGCAGVDDRNHECSESATFKIKRDDESIWHKNINAQQAARCFSLNVRDSFGLELITTKQHHEKACEHTAWVNADLCVTTDVLQKVDCEVGPWEDFGNCTQPCGTGYMSRTRKITTSPQHGGKACPRVHEVSPCNEQPCPVDCKLDKWEDYGPCSATCAGGYQTRRRSELRAAAHGGKQCGPLTETQMCNTTACPVDCKTTDTAEDGSPLGFGPCSHECGGGIKIKKLRVIQEAAHNGLACPTLTVSQSCNEAPCRVDCKLEPFGEWSPCTRECGTGYKTRSRSIERQAAHGGKPCGVTTQTHSCNEKHCPIDCELRDAYDWHSKKEDGKERYPCSRSCGTGTRTRYKSIKIYPAYGGRPCPSLQETVTCKKQECPVDCQVSHYSTWSVCSKSCGSGIERKRRSVVRKAAHGGKGCGSLEVTRECQKQSCPVDCVMSDYGEWGWDDGTGFKDFACSKKCDGGVQSRSKTVITKGENGGLACPVKRVQEQPCNTHKCPIDCELNDWQTWSPCSATCGKGWQHRTRTVKREAQFGGKHCSAEYEQQACNMDACEIPCKYTPWSANENYDGVQCSKSCGGGVKKRMRSVIQQSTTQSCGDIEQSIECNPGACPEDCTMHPWEVWSDCSVTCGFGHQTRSRKVDRKRLAGGKKCPADFEQRQCNAGPCNSKCEVGPWEAWSDCSATCGTGQQTRERSVKYPDNGAAQHAGLNGAYDGDEADRQDCPFSTQVRNCNQQACSVDCQTNDWFEWSPCTRTCGTGWKKRHRTIRKYKQGNGASCGALHEVKTCRTTPCPVHCIMDAWTFWGSGGIAGKCSQQCGKGQQVRTREIYQQPLYGGKACSAPRQERTCNSQPCPIPCEVEDNWTRGDCSVSCGGGVEHQTKSVLVPAAYGGRACPATSQMVACKEQHCPIDCLATQWSEWTPCSKSCGGKGTRTRRRAVDRQARFGGKGCGEMKQTLDCNEGECPAHCQVSEWTEWGECSKPCREKRQAGLDANNPASYYPAGERTRQRAVIKFSNFGGYACPELSQSMPCNDKFCPQDCELTDWGTWGVPEGESHSTTEGFQCTRACGTGRQTRTRDIVHPMAHGGKDCAPRKEERNCNTHNCPIDCEFSAFGWNNVEGKWSDCSRDCGGGFKQQRRRITVASAYGGKACPSTTRVESCGQEECPQDCQLSAWTWYSPCSATCGGGKKRRTRTIHKPHEGTGKPCSEYPMEEVKDCNMAECPVDCKMKPWGDWDTCSKHCGLGQHTRTREVDIPRAHGGKECDTKSQTRNCKIMDCPVDCVLSNWQSGGTDKCNVGCGGGVKRRYRQVEVSPDHGGQACGPLYKTEPCNTHPCPVHCVVNDYSDWTACSRTCGTGIMTRTRTVRQHAQHGGSACPDTRSTRACNTKPCPVDCEVTAYDAWSECTVSCGMGFKFRTRTITTSPSTDGKACPALTETGFCNQDVPCPVDCQYSDWGSWSQCDKTCGGGFEKRVRTITRPMLHDGKPCPPTEEKKQCFRETCPIDCEMEAWPDNWGDCSVSCGNGVYTKTRQIIIKPGPKGKACGATEMTKKCDMGACPVDCVMGPWKPWGKCSKPCNDGKGAGQQERRRTIISKGNSIGAVCGSKLDVRDCNDHACPVDCKMASWGSDGGWGACSRTCGGGTQTRTRNVLVPAAHGGLRCPQMGETRSCKEQNCPRDCLLGEWSDWSHCTKSCNNGSGPGKKFATRKVLQHQANGGDACAIEDNASLTKKEISCNDHDCPKDCTMTPWGSYTPCSRSCAEVIKDHMSRDANDRRHAWHTRERVVDHNAQFGGRGCPHTFERSVCNTYAECMTVFFGDKKLEVASEDTTNMDVNTELVAARKNQDNSAMEAKQAAAVAATTTVSPEAKETTTHYVITEPRTCTMVDPSDSSKNTVLEHGWHGAGVGSNWCNLCRCNDGSISCQKKNCGTDKLTVGEMCSHTTCEVKEQGEHKVIWTTHSSKENYGSLHHCAYMLNTEDCQCHCFGTTFAEITAASK